MTIELALAQIWASTFNILPNVIAAIILLLVGWVLGKVIGKVVKEVLRKLRLDRYFKFGEAFKVSEIFSIAIAWIIYLVFIKAAVGTLGIVALDEFVGSVLAFIPKILGAMIIILVGYVIANYVQREVTKTKTEYSKTIGKVIFFFTLVISIAIALPFLQIDTTLINGIILILVASIGLGLAIAIGLGMKDTVKEMSKKYAKKK
ncbi:MAG: mechanosensitive ion channel family protein [Candidatus Heimdallarchaeaceae archaeon]